MRAVFGLVVAAALLCGCAAQATRNTEPAAAAPSAASAGMPPAAGATNLVDTEWRFVEVAGAPVPDGVVATLRLRDGRASGKAGCNTYGARYHVAADGSAGFTQTLSTRMACLQPAGAMRVERGVFDALEHTARIRRDADALVLLDASGKPLAKLQRRTP